MARVLVKREIVEVKSESVVRIRMKHGTPTKVHEVDYVYTLKCGHEEKRTTSFSRQRNSLSDRVHCYTCAGGAQ